VLFDSYLPKESEERETVFFCVTQTVFPFTNRPQPRRGSLGTEHELTIYIKLNSPETYIRTHIMLVLDAAKSLTLTP
jgi:hypothetical protein